MQPKLERIALEKAQKTTRQHISMTQFDKK